MSKLENFAYLKASNSNSKKAPLIVMFHGYGSNKEDLFDLRNIFGDRFDYLALQGPVDLSHMGGQNSYAWFNLEFTDRGIRYNTEEIDPLITKMVATLTDIKKRYAANRPLYVLGFSQGAMLCHALLLKAGHLIDAAACLSGRKVDELFTGKQDWKGLENKPVFISHGISDEVIPINVGGRAIRDFYKTSPVNMLYKEYNMGHGIDYECQRHLTTWLGKVFSGKL